MAEGCWTREGEPSRGTIREEAADKGLINQQEILFRRPPGLGGDGFEGTKTGESFGFKSSTVRDEGEEPVEFKAKEGWSRIRLKSCRFDSDCGGMGHFLGRVGEEGRLTLRMVDVQVPLSGPGDKRVKGLLNPRGCNLPIRV